MKIYTKTGDSGDTSLFGGKRVPKDDLRIETYGTIDELNALIGVVASYLVLGELGAHKQYLEEFLRSVQQNLFTIGGMIAAQDATWFERVPHIQKETVDALEQLIDTLAENLPPLTTFVLPGGSLLASHVHQARTVCRRAERLCVGLQGREGLDHIIIQYLNRLSDAFFIIARWVNHQEGRGEIVWKK